MQFIKKGKNDNKNNKRAYPKNLRPLNESLRSKLRSKLLYKARRLLHSAIDSGEGKDAIAAVGTMLKLSNDNKEKILKDIGGALLENRVLSPNNLMKARTLCFVLMHLHQNGWAMLEGWEQIQPQLENYSRLLFSSLEMGSLNGADLFALEALSFLAPCGAYDYDSNSLKGVLNRFIKRPEAALPFYNLTGALSENGPEELQTVAEEMEERRIALCKEGLEYATDRQFIAASELILAFKMGRTYLAPVLEEIRDEMLDVREEPGVYQEEYDDPEDAAEENERVNKMKERMRKNATQILKELQNLGIPVPVETGGESTEELKKTGGSAFSAISPDELPMLFHMVMNPTGETEEEMESNRQAALEELRDIQEAGVELTLQVECPVESDPVEIADVLSTLLHVLEAKGVDMELILYGERSSEVNEMLKRRKDA